LDQSIAHGVRISRLLTELEQGQGNEEKRDE
jgi:hypothetical protein